MELRVQLDENRLLRNLDWNLLHTFHIIVQAGNLTRAAAHLGRQQPAISLALRRLEGHLGTDLCIRASNRFELTPDGMLVAQVCQDLFQRVRDLPNNLANLPSHVVGHLRLVMVSSITSSRIDESIAKFHQQCPLVQIEIDVVPWEDVTRRLARQTADIGIAPARFINSDFVFDLLYTEPIKFYCGKGHPLYGRVISDPDELAGEGIILTGGDEPDIISKFRFKHGIGRVVAGQSEYLDEVKRLAVAGVGICFLPEPFARIEVENGLLWPVLDDTHQFTAEIFTVSLPREQLQLPARLFAEIVASC